MFVPSESPVMPAGDVRDALLWALWDRHYDQTQGRFASLDPDPGQVRSPLSLHKYAYAHEDPVNNADPSGRSIIGFVGGFLNSLWTRFKNAVSAIAAYVSATIQIWWARAMSLMNQAWSWVSYRLSMIGSSTPTLQRIVQRLQTAINQVAPKVAAGPKPTLPVTPNNMSPAEFGHQVMKWGSGTDPALLRIENLTRAELVRAGVTPDMAMRWRDFYIWVAADNPDNPSAPARALLMQYAYELLSGGG